MIKYLVLCVVSPLLSAIAGGVFLKLGIRFPLPFGCESSTCKRASFYRFSVSLLLGVFSLVAVILALIDGYGVLVAAFLLVFIVCLAVAWCCYACACVVDTDGNIVRRRDVFLKWRDCQSDSGAEACSESGEKNSRQNRLAVYTAVYLAVAVILVLAMCIIAVSGKPYSDIRAGKVVFSDYSESEGVLFPISADSSEASYLVLDYRKCVLEPSRLIREIAEGKEFRIKYAVLYDDKWEGQYVLLEIIGEDGTVFLRESDAAKQRAGSTVPSITALGVTTVIWIALGAWFLFISDPEKLFGKFKRTGESGRGDSLDE